MTILNSKLNEKNKLDILKISTILVFIFPILPLLLASIWTSFMLMFTTITYLASTPEIKVERVVLWIALFAWFIGGSVGSLALIRVLQNKRTKTTLWLLMYGIISYSILTLPIIFSGIKEFLIHGNPLKLLLILYVILTLFVMGKQLLKTAKEVSLS